MEMSLIQHLLPHTTTSQSHKTSKEEFVSNLHGSSILEIVALSAVIPAFVLLRQVAAHIYETVSEDKRADSSNCAEELKSQEGNYVGELTADFILVVFSEHVYGITVYTYLMLLTAIVYLNWQQPLTSYVQSNALASTYQTSCLSCYRFVMMLVTCVTILAVDFNVFPRRFAKAETYGTGMMDLGVGSFVVANALVSRQARNLAPRKHGGVVRNVSPHLILGFMRLALTKGVDYQVHVGEYGVHWNFYFTLAAVSLLTSLIHIPTYYCGLLGVVVLTVYQALLLFGWNKYLLSSDRGPGLVSLNKEGFFSIFGYWGLHLLSVQFGQYLCFTTGRFLKKFFPNLEKGAASQKWWAAVEILLLDIILWMLGILFHQFVENVSRRMCNVAYVMFVLAQNFQVIGLFSLADLVTKRKLLLQEVFDKNLLLTFLLANVLTGLVNLSMNTVNAPVPVSLLVLLLYMAILVLATSSLKALNLRLKFW
ncbi:hypothetical protein O6H91_17G005900 [Diphasiastrum complanatum]|uniref:Uncharacterized protein n=1 Tax=Diphasiastrum complanatum TaxID=34168 RepID=A0ACC2B3Y6_DIPCM|nr:hypothetical protein O6H91_17G005900 [Diphasiastrum complanatum]